MTIAPNETKLAFNSETAFDQVPDTGGIYALFALETCLLIEEADNLRAVLTDRARLEIPVQGIKPTHFQYEPVILSLRSTLLAALKTELRPLSEGRA